MTELTKQMVDERDAAFLVRITEPLLCSSIKRQYVKHAPTNLTVAQVITAAEEAHPHRVVTANVNCNKGITLVICKKVGER